MQSKHLQVSTYSLQLATNKNSKHKQVQSRLANHFVHNHIQDLFCQEKGSLETCILYSHIFHNNT